MFKIQCVTGHTLRKEPIISVFFADSLMGARFSAECVYSTDDPQFDWESAMGGYMAKFGGAPIILITKEMS